MTPDEAEIARLYRRVREEPRSLAFVALGDALRRDGQLGEGLQVLREGFRAHPDHPAARVVLARIHLDMGNRALATEVLSEVVRTDPENLAATALLARLHVEDGRVADARPLVERLRHADHPDAAARELALLGAPPADAGLAPSDDPFETPAVAARLARAGHYHRAWLLWQRLSAPNPDSAAAAAAVAALERNLAGLGDADGEAPLGEHPRRALPGLAETWQALLDESADLPAPRGAHPVARWARRIWRAS